MRILSLHADNIKFKPIKKAIPQAEEAKKREISVSECLVVFIAVEEGDEVDINAAAQTLAENVKEITEQVKAKKVVLYPYAHLSSKLAQAKEATQILSQAAKQLEKSYKVIQAPFGWYKAFSIQVKGHPLAELSREISITGEKVESQAVEAEKKLASKWYILSPAGKLAEIKARKNSITGFNFTKFPNLLKFAKYEISKDRTAHEEPPHVRAMKKLTLVNYDKASDPGNFKYYPKGRLIKSLIEDYVTQRVHESGAVEVETPIMYDLEHPALKAYLNRFPARQYQIKTPNKQAFLRFSACFGQFLMLHDSIISYKNLPLSIYELTKYSFRAEQHGELSGLRRLRTFTMPDCHAICTDIQQAKTELFKRFELAKSTQETCGLGKEDLEIGLRVTKKFYQQNKSFINSLARKWGKPLLVEMWAEQFFYFNMKYEFNFIDGLNKAAALATDQIDTENSKNFEITYVDPKGKKQYPIIMHLSPCGAIERVIYALLEKACMQEQAGKNPSLPLWLSPTQVRIVPVSSKYISEAAKLAEQLPFRVDIDDRNLHVEKRILEAEQEWVPYTIVLGERELKSKKLAVRIRKQGGKVKQMTKPALKAELKEQLENMPSKPLPLPMLLSKRPKFV